MLRVQQQTLNNRIALVNINQRAFGGKKKKSQETEEDTATEQEEVVAEEPVEETPAPVEPTPAPVEPKPDFSAAGASQPAQEVSKDLFGSFSVGTIN